MADARFEDAPPTERPLRLKAADEDDLAVLSSLVQDAVGRIADIRWMARRHRAVLLLNRFRWEDAPVAERQGRPFERVRTALTIEGALKLRARGLDPKKSETVFAVLALGWTPGEDGGGELIVACAGGAEIRAEVECLDLALTDLTKPWQARAGAPEHDV